MDEFLLGLSRDGRLTPQSPDEDLASRLTRQAREFLRAARPLAKISADGAALLCHLAVYHAGRALLAAKGYRPADGDPYRPVAAFVKHRCGKLPGPCAALEPLLEHWSALTGDPDMPLPRFAPGSPLREAEALVRALEKELVREFPAYKKLLSPSKKAPRTISPERSFRD